MSWTEVIRLPDKVANGTEEAFAQFTKECIAARITASIDEVQLTQDPEDDMYFTGIWECGEVHGWFDLDGPLAIGSFD